MLCLKFAFAIPRSHGKNTDAADIDSSVKNTPEVESTLHNGLYQSGEGAIRAKEKRRCAQKHTPRKAKHAPYFRNSTIAVYKAVALLMPAWPKFLKTFSTSPLPHQPLSPVELSAI